MVLLNFFATIAKSSLPSHSYQKKAKPKIFNHTAVFSTEISPLPAGRSISRRRAAIVF